MASSATITVPTTASRFALLQIDSDSDSDASDVGKTSSSKGGRESGKARHGKAGASGGKAGQCNAKKRDKKKKKKEQQQTEANELRNLAFKKIPPKSCAPPPCMTLSGIASELLSPASTDPNIPSEDWQQWKQRDEQITTDLYEADLEKALILSKLEFEQQKQIPNTKNSSPKSRAKESGGKKEKKKNQQAKDKKTVSLQDFQSEDHLNKKQEKEDTRAANLALGIGQEERFFNKLEDDVSRIIQQEKRREQYANDHGHEVSTSAEHERDPRAEQLKYELEKKDKEIDKLKKIISQWEEKYKEVKARNSQLLKMLQQGEMKDKAEILLQVEELLHIKEELSSQVTLLHGALEQERSKVKGLQTEQPKHPGNKKGKKGSETDI
ncbi:G kinase-anchoring protein 1 isoform X1 [Takifugu rubripes]|uniref:G kinase anchoring protein 1 n=2 Tax=Takifugu TaxID=31032 RepID=H2TUF1_TAKRU|nr:G kinase-anchoring protein 1 isoform X1 [Takifugu rubripes]XP_056888737.1 G kinase-anchoring protein 1 isoform X1 [Takifugu flavidus]TWW60515.1 G kinase-anchoring protein 1-A [Takifugu flavidus]|eukprot:XP_011613869.1 PREDICTED: G kinase-anchoring protein 1 [Takifugu rubripes]